MRLAFFRPIWVCALAWALAGHSDELPDLFTEQFQRLAGLTQSSEAELRLEGVQGLCWLKHFSAEPHLLKLADDPAPEVRREVAFTLRRVGRRDLPLGREGRAGRQVSPRGRHRRRAARSRDRQAPDRGEQPLRRGRHNLGAPTVNRKHLHQHRRAGTNARAGWLRSK